MKTIINEFKLIEEMDETIIDEKITKRGEEDAKGIIKTIKMILEEERLNELVEITVEREVRRHREDTVVVYKVVIEPRRGRCLKEDVVESLLYYLREMRVEDWEEMIGKVDVMMDIKITFTLHYYCYKELKFYIICF